MKDLHMHTVFSDGKNTPEEMVEEAIRLGLDTVGISDHSHLDPCGMTLEAGAEYRAELARLKKKYAGRIRVLCGLERDFISDDFVFGFGNRLKCARLIRGRFDVQSLQKLRHTC